MFCACKNVWDGHTYWWLIDDWYERFFIAHHWALVCEKKIIDGSGHHIVILVSPMCRSCYDNLAYYYPLKNHLKKRRERRKDWKIITYFHYLSRTIDFYSVGECLIRWVMFGYKQPNESRFCNIHVSLGCNRHNLVHRPVRLLQLVEIELKNRNYAYYFNIVALDSYLS